MDRRRFLATASTSALVLAAHRQLGWAVPLLEETPMPDEREIARIARLRLSCGAPLAEMKRFYSKTLGLPLLQESRSEIKIGAGTTPVTFVATDRDRPFYHFAFNIPQNKLRKARAWQLERSELIPIFPDMRDPGYPDDVVHFRHWNAHSVFFFDPAGNVVEYIARHDLDNDREGEFSTADILYASEIAFIVDDVSATSAILQETFRLDQYSIGSEAFRALGDEQGLLLVFQRGRNLTRGMDEPTPAEVFPIEAGIRSETGTELVVPDFPYTIRTS